MSNLRFETANALATMDSTLAFKGGVLSCLVSALSFKYSTLTSEVTGPRTS